MLNYFKKGKNTTEKEKTELWTVYGEGAVTDQTCQKWFAKVPAGGFLLDGAPWLGRPVEVDTAQIETLAENSQRYTEVADILRTSKSSTENELHQLACVHYFDVWVPHKWSEKSLLDLFSTCSFLLKHNQKCFVFKTNCDQQWKDTVQ